MKTNEDKDLERFVADLMKQTSPDSPSPEFTTRLMMQVQVEKMERATLYKPLIPKWGWVCIFGAVILLLSFLYLSGNTASGSWFGESRFDIDLNSVFSGMALVRISSVTFYAVVLACVLLLIQISLLKNYFNKRMT